MYVFKSASGPNIMINGMMISLKFQKDCVCVCVWTEDFFSIDL